MKLPYAFSGILTLALLALGCSSADGELGESAAPLCTPGEVFPCGCTDGSTSQQVCNDSGALDPCLCGATTGTGGTTSTGTGGFVSTGGAVASGGTNVGTGGTVVGTGGDVGTGGTIAGTGGDVGMGGTVPAGGTPSGGTTGLPPVTTAQDPVIPAVNGPCPTFVTQTLDFGSLLGINMQAGPPSNGTGVLVFYWHGTGSSAGEVGFLGGNAQRILDTGGVIISPQSSTGATNGLQASGTSIWFEEDLVTADQIVACAVQNHGIDPRRIYATGCSAGGLMSGYMAAQRSQYIAAVAPNSGGALGQSFIGLPHVPQVMTMHGAMGADVVIIDFADQSLQFTAAVVSAGGFAIDCDHGGGHCGAPGDLYTSAVTFLLDHPFGVSPEPYGAGLPPGFPPYCQVQ